MTSVDQEIPKAYPGRIKGIIFQPRSEWPKIEAERFVPAIYTYIAVLSAIPSVSKMAGILIFGYPGPIGTRFRPPLASMISDALLEYALTLASIFVLVLIVEFLSPVFGGKRDRRQAIKTIAYAGTAVWLTGFFSLVPGLGILQLAGLYSVYLLFLGLPVTMKTSKTWTTPFTALVGMAAVFLTLTIKALSL